MRSFTIRNQTRRDFFTNLGLVVSAASLFLGCNSEAQREREKALFAQDPALFFKVFPTSIEGASKVEKHQPKDFDRVLVHIRQTHESSLTGIMNDPKDIRDVQQNILMIAAELNRTMGLHHYVSEAFTTQTLLKMEQSLPSIRLKAPRGKKEGEEFRHWVVGNMGERMSNAPSLASLYSMYLNPAFKVLPLEHNGSIEKEFSLLSREIKELAIRNKRYLDYLDFKMGNGTADTSVLFPHAVEDKAWLDANAQRIREKMKGYFDINAEKVRSEREEPVYKAADGVPPHVPVGVIFGGNHSFVIEAARRKMAVIEVTPIGYK